MGHNNKRPMGLDDLLKNKLGNGPKFKKLHIHSLSQDVEIEHIFVVCAAGSEILADFQNCHIWPWNLDIGQNSRSGTCPVHSLSNPDTDRFSKLPYIWAWNLASGQSSRSISIPVYPLSTLGGRNWAYFCSTGSGFRDTGHFQNFHIWAWIPEVALIFSFYPKWGGNWAYIHSTGSGFRGTGPFWKLPYLGMKLSKWPKFQKLHIHSLSTPRSQNWAYFCSTGSSFQDTGQFSNLPIWAWILASAQSSRSCTCTIFLPQGVEIEHIFD